MNNKKPFFSIIMPVFNTEKYLGKAINSILNQTFKDFELILIDDCSKDSSYLICEKFINKDSRVKLLKNDINLGVAKTRNIALNNISGKYLTFVDSDDYIEINLLEIVYDIINNNNVDFLKYSCKEEYVDEKEQLLYTKICQVKNCFLDDKIKIQNKIIDMEKVPLFGYLCNSFYKVDIIQENKILFDEKCTVNEDFVFNVKYILYIKNLYCIDFLGYHYMKRKNNSLSTKKQDNYYKMHMMKIYLLLDMCNKHSNLTKKNKEIIYWMYIRYIYSTIERNLSNKDYLINLINNIKKEKLYNQFLLVEFKNITMKQKIMIYILKTQKSKILIAFVKLISWIKNKLPIFFAKIK